MPLSNLLLAAGAMVTVGLTPASEVTLPGRQIRLGDVADLSAFALSERSRLAPLVLAAVPAGRSRITLSRAAVGALVRRGVPGLGVRSQAEAESLTFLVPTQAAQRARGGCSELARPLAAGSPVSVADLVPVDCRDEAASGLRFDRLNGVARAESGLAAGAYLGRIAAAPAVAVDKGAKLTLVATAGPVRVTREVVALQAGRSGGKVFVRDAEGHVTSAPLVVQEGAGR
jgi:flagella basal body P-ring formation protein FlgA